MGLSVLDSRGIFSLKVSSSIIIIDKSLPPRIQHSPRPPAGDLTGSVFLLYFPREAPRVFSATAAACNIVIIDTDTDSFTIVSSS